MSGCTVAVDTGVRGWGTLGGRYVAETDEGGVECERSPVGSEKAMGERSGRAVPFAWLEDGKKVAMLGN